MLLGYTVSEEYSNQYNPVFYRLGKEEEQEQLKTLLSQVPTLQIYDTIKSQLSELAKISNPHTQLTAKETEAFVAEYTGGVDLNQFGVWVYYPWSKKLVHLLDEEDFIRLRTSRNLYKITPEELTTLRTKRIGIIGLSVGQSIALTIATERICGELYLADFDTIELSNMNRLSNSNLYNLGTLKAVATAQKIAELDPYIKITCFEKGINEENIDAFLGASESKIDILVEECDSLDVKILARIKAKAKGIPVVMDTNDRGMLDIERFDLEPERPIFHGAFDGTEIDINASKDLTIEQKTALLAKIFDFSLISDRMRRSLGELGKTINAWPQLASSVVLGGAMVTDTCRRMLLDEIQFSGRYYIDFNDLIKNQF